MTHYDLYFIPEHQRLQRILDWQKWVVAHPPRCPNCDEQRQLQIRDALDAGGPLWKCRMCRHKFHHPAPAQPSTHN